MNVNNFFRFIGEKKPEYKLSSENKELIDQLKYGYEEDVREFGDSYEDYKELIPMEVEGKGHFDENGNKQGLFLNINASYEVEQGYGEEPNEYHFSFYNVYSNYKDDLKDGIETTYSTYRGNDVVLYTTEYKNGKKNGKRTKYRSNGDGAILLVTHYVDDKMVQNDHFYDNQKIAWSRYYSQTKSRANSDILTTIDSDKPTTYYSYDTGEVIDEETYRKQNYFMKVRNVYT